VIVEINRGAFHVGFGDDPHAVLFVANRLTLYKNLHNPLLRIRANMTLKNRLAANAPLFSLCRSNLRCVEPR
jgi:hypothetical protein